MSPMIPCTNRAMRRARPPGPGPRPGRARSGPGSRRPPRRRRGSDSGTRRRRPGRRPSGRGSRSDRPAIGCPPRSGRGRRSRITSRLAADRLGVAQRQIEFAVERQRQDVFAGTECPGDRDPQGVIRGDHSRVRHVGQFQDVQHAADRPGGAELERLDDVRVVVEQPRQRGEPADGRAWPTGIVVSRARTARSAGWGSIRTPSVSVAPRPGSSRSAGSGRTVVKANCRVRQSSIRFDVPGPAWRVCTRSISRSSVPSGSMPRVTPCFPARPSGWTASADPGRPAPFAARRTRWC